MLAKNRNRLSARELSFISVLPRAKALQRETAALPRPPLPGMERGGPGPIQTPHHHMPFTVPPLPARPLAMAPPPLLLPPLQLLPVLKLWDTSEDSLQERSGQQLPPQMHLQQNDPLSLRLHSLQYTTVPTSGARTEM